VRAMACPSVVRSRAVCALTAIGLAAAGLFCSSARAQPLNVSLAPGVAFPDRTLVVSLPPGPWVTAGRMHVTENGAPVSGLSVTPLSHANPGDFGVELVIDSDPSMGGGVMANAMLAARALASQRTGQQQLGVVFSGSRGAVSNQGTVALPLSTDPLAIQRALDHGPQVGPGTHLLPAIALAIRQLAEGKIAAGAVILVTDDIDTEPGLTPQAVAAIARAAHVRLYIVGVRDSAFTPQFMGEIAQAGGGQFIAANPADVSRIFTQIQAVLIDRYVVHYRSTQPLGREVTLSVRADGVPGSFTTTYATPSPAAPRSKASATDRSFWTSTLAVVLVGAACALLLAIVAALLLSQYARQSTITSRVGEFIPTSPEPDVIQGSVTGAALRRTEAALHGRSWWPAFVEDVDIARMGRSPTDLAYLAAIGSIVAAALLILLTGSPLLGIPALLVGPFTLRAVVNMRLRKQRSLFEDQLASNLEEVASAVRSGRSIVEALAIVSGATEEPTRSEFDRALANERLGRPLEETLQPIARRMRSDGMEQVAVVAAMHRRTGSSVAEALDRVSEGTRERAELQRELNALTAQGRLARWILTALPPVLLLAFTIIDSRYERPMYHTTGGLLALGIGALMVVAGSLVMKRIVDIEV
jgi:tight adherence protein B